MKVWTTTPVVNEALLDGETSSPDWRDRLRENVWWLAFSPDGSSPSSYIEAAFRTAFRASRSRCRNTKFFYNDYLSDVRTSDDNVLNKAEALYGMVKHLRAADVPIHGVGLQMHVSIQELLDRSASEGRPLSAVIATFGDELAAYFQKIADLGLQIQITEMDVRSPLDDDELRERAAEIYSTVLQACTTQDACTGFTVWGFSSLHSWIPRAFVDTEPVPFLLLNGYHPTRAYCAVHETLTGEAIRCQ